MLEEQEAWEDWCQVPEALYQVCRALEGCQVSCVPSPELGLVGLVEGALELTQVKCTIL